MANKEGFEVDSPLTAKEAALRFHPALAYLALAGGSELDGPPARSAMSLDQRQGLPRLQLTALDIES